MKLSKTITAILLAQAAVAVPYAGLAAHIATIAAGTAAQGDALKAARTGLWDSFKAAIPLALEAEHNAETMRAGLEIACMNANVPAGTFRGYVSTVQSLYADIEAGELSAAEVEAISVKDARERYMNADKKALATAKAALLARVKGWTVEELGLLVLMCDDINQPAEAQPSGEVVGPTVEAQAA